MQCQFVDDNAMDAHALPVEKADKSESCLRVQVLSVYSFPTGGNKRQFGICLLNITNARRHALCLFIAR